MESHHSHAHQALDMWEVLTHVVKERGPRSYHRLARFNLRMCCECHVLMASPNSTKLD